MKTKTFASRATDELLSRRPLEMKAPAMPSTGIDHRSIRETLATHLTDPAHRFHSPAGSHDNRTTVSAGGALQRMRGRRH